MSVRFAAARSALSTVVRTKIVHEGLRAANDNGETIVVDHMLESALRHFAEHGMGAARAARNSAETAFFEDDMDAYRWWLSVCRTLDRRMADTLEQRGGANLCQQGA